MNSIMGSAGLAPDIETASADYANRFSGSAGRYLLAAQEAAVREVLAPYAGGSLLELGGGHGQLLALYQSLDMGVTLHGSDPACFARLDGPEFQRATTVVGPYLDLELPQKSFDVVLAVRLVSHEPDWQRLLAEMCRLARRAVIFDYASTRSLNALGPALLRWKKQLEGNTRPYQSFGGRELAAELRRVGFGRTTEKRQLFWPMVLHRKLGANILLRGMESVCRGIGLTRLVGSPVILRAERSEDRES